MLNDVILDEKHREPKSKYLQQGALCSILYSLLYSTLINYEKYGAHLRDRLAKKVFQVNRC